MSWQWLPLEIQVRIVSFIPSKHQYSLRRTCSSISNFPIEWTECDQYPSFREILKYLELQVDLIRSSKYVETQKNFGLIQTFTFTNFAKRKTLVLDGHLNGEIQNLRGYIIPFNRLEQYLYGFEICYLATDLVTMLHMGYIIISNRTLYSKNSAMIGIAFYRFLLRISMARDLIQTLMKVKDERLNNWISEIIELSYPLSDDLTSELKRVFETQTKLESYPLEETDLNEGFVIKYWHSRIGSMELLDMVNPNNDDNYLLIMCIRECDLCMLLALLNRCANSLNIVQLIDSCPSYKSDFIKLLVTFGADSTST